MAKDPTAFRERFKAYKNGKSVKEVYDAGLPRFANGTGGVQNNISEEYTPLMSNVYQPMINSAKQQVAKFAVDDYAYRVQKQHPEVTKEQLLGIYNSTPYIGSDSRRGTTVGQYWHGEDDGYGRRVMVYPRSMKSDDPEFNLQDRIQSTVLHESNHLLRDAVLGGKYTDKEREYLETAYPGVPINEAAALNAQIREKLSNAYGNGAVGEKLDATLEKVRKNKGMQNEMMFHLNNLNGYGHADKVNGQWDPKTIDAMINSLMNVASVQTKPSRGLLRAKDGKLPKYGDGTIPYTSSDGSSYNINPNVVGSKLLNIAVPEVVVTGNDRRPMYQRYDAYNSTYDPENIEKGFNAFTLGGLNNLSPTQWARRAYDASKLLSGDMSFKNYTDRWINGNEGIVSANFLKHNPISSFVINGIGDAALLGIGTQGGRIAHNVANRNLFFYRDMAPYTYDKPYKKALKAAKSILTEEKIDLPDNYTPQWMNNTDGAGTIGYLGPVRKDITDAAIADPMGEGIKRFDEYAKNQILLLNRFRDAAYRKYLGLPEKEPVYIKNPTNDTYSYNLPYIKKLYNEYGVSPSTHAMSLNADWLTSNAGGLEKSEIIPFGHGISTDIDKAYSVQHMVDTWDLHPFRRVENQILPKYTAFIQKAADKIYTNLYDRVYKNPNAYKYLGGRYLNKVRYDDQSVPFRNLILKVSKKALNFEAGPVLGGKPFVMDSWVPLTRKYDYNHGANIVETVGLDALNILPLLYFDWLKTLSFPSSMYTLTIK